MDDVQPVASKECNCPGADEFIKNNIDKHPDIAEQTWWHRLDCPISDLFDQGQEVIS